MKLDLELYRSRPITDLSGTRQSKGSIYDIPINRHNPLHKERDVDLRKLGIAGANYQFKILPTIAGAIENLFVRKTVASILLDIDRELREVGLMLYVSDAYRPIQVQRIIYWRNFWKIKKGKTKLSDEDIRKEMSGWITKVPPKKRLFLSPPPHSTGGAVDLDIRQVDGEKLEFGKGKGLMYPDYFEHESKQRSLSAREEEARKNRRLLYWLMTEHGFVCNPTEWWHYSIFDQMYADQMGLPAALYGYLGR
ncbi:MAG: M15 family metallopeptidase [bacterium]